MESYGDSDSKRSPLQYKRPGFNIWVRKIHWRRECNTLQYSCLDNFMDRVAWPGTVHGIAKSCTQLTD